MRQLVLLFCLVGGFMALAGCASTGSTRVVDLRCEDKTTPIGIDVRRPLLGWRMESAEREMVQSGYRILVASNPEVLADNRGDIWDSGEIAGDESVNVEYRGPAIESGRTVYWKVLARDQNGREQWSEPATWEMGLLEPGDWRAKWIDFPTAEGAMPTTAPATTRSTGKHLFPPNFPPYLRKTFDVNKPVKRARLYATALGLYQCWVNGRQAGDAVLAPDWTNYHHRVRYQTFDVTQSLRSGQNVIGAVLGDGWYSGNICWIGGHVYGSRPAMLAQLVIDYADGSREIVGSDETWRAATGPIRHSDFQDGEEYDARLEMPGWNTVGFNDSSWKPVSLRNEKPSLEAQIGPAVRRTHEIAAKKVTEAGPGKYVFDFGQNMVGFARLSAEAPAGTKVTIRFAEMLKPDGTIYTENLRTARQTDSYVFKGTGKEVWEPSFTFHGFRYAEVSGFPGKIQPEMLTGIVIGSDNAQSGTFECSNPMLNQLYSNIVWGQRGNFVSIPTDCPQRDERLGWMGDAQVFIRTATYNCDVREFFDSWLVEVADAQTKDGAFTDVSPHVAAGEGTAAWADAGIICPWTIYQMYGDKRILERQYPSMARYIDYLKKNSKKLIRPAEGYGDWLSIAADTPKDLLATAYFAHSVDLMARMAEIIGKPADAAAYSKLFGGIRTAFNKKFVAKDGRISGNTQTGYLLALKFNLVDEPNRSRAVKYLIEDIAAKKDHLSTGFVGVSYLLPVLTRFGELDLAYRLMNQETFPSWLFPVKMGATTIWERWDGWTPEKGFQTPTMNSFNHYSLGSCGEWMFESIAGIGLDEDHPGFKHVIIRPRIGGGLTWAKGSYQSQYGEIKTDWAITDGRVTVAVTIPANTSATVYVPAGKGSEILESGKLVDDKTPGIAFVRWENGAWIFRVGSGEYVFSSTFEHHGV